MSKSIDPALMRPEILVDMQISLERISPKLNRILRQFAPFGPGNMAPVLWQLVLEIQDMLKG